MIRSLYCFFLGMLVLSGCAPSHILHYREDVSRDFTTISFSANRAPYYHRSQVGGEHMSFVQVLGFEGAVFRIELILEVGNVDCSIYGEGVVVESDPAGDNTQIVTVVDGEVLFSVGLSAYPYGEYTLKISNL
ncbi:hypothetical protein [Syntrophotalea carbinolica]|nr:hypothetical protein [Syntrophotalea carbinolica]